jgi:hypothetical protein
MNLVLSKFPRGIQYVARPESIRAAQCMTLDYVLNFFQTALRPRSGRVGLKSGLARDWPRRFAVVSGHRHSIRCAVHSSCRRRICHCRCGNLPRCYPGSANTWSRATDTRRRRRHRGTTARLPRLVQDAGTCIVTRNSDGERRFRLVTRGAGAHSAPRFSRFRETRRVLREGGICSHQIDLQDHLGVL